jgi:hypothetical protein
MRHNKEYVMNLARQFLSHESSIGNIYPVRRVLHLFSLSLII